MADPDPIPPAESPPTPEQTDKLLADRRAKLDRLREAGVDPFGGPIHDISTLADARAAYDADADRQFQDDPDAGDDRARTIVGGRVIQHRVMGNLIFMHLRDATGDLQVAVSKKAVPPDSFKLAKSLIERGDWVVAGGALGNTTKGELSVWADRFELASKSLALPPNKFQGLQDPEQRYRRRYVDLYDNPDVMTTMQKRIAIIDAIRDYFRGRGFVEVETPMLQAIHGGAAARPFQTHHNALNLPLSLRIAPELYLKRLLVGGMPKVFEINRNFRNEGISPRHNPEFTMLEAYEAFGSWETMAQLVEDMICTVAEEVCGGLVLDRRGAEDAEEGTAEDASASGSPTIDLRGDQSKPRGQRWPRVSMVDLVEEKTGWRFDPRDPPTDLAAVLAPGVGDRTLDLDAKSPAEQLVEVYEKLVEPTLIDPVFVTHVPSQIIPLAKRNVDDPFFADVYELAIGGLEISPGYSELNDPDEQEARLAEQVGDDAERQAVDPDFLDALRVGMPPAGGMGLGIDRLVMLLTGAASIRDVIFFPLMRPRGEQ
jgi:lysyl-tRNA synthetase class 2